MNSSTSLASHSPSTPAQGDFSITPAPGLLAELVRGRISGTLRVERGGVVKVLYFNQGDLACASSNAEEDRLGNLLVRHGRLSADQLAHAKSKQPEKSTIGNILVELGFITSAELLWGARRQVEEILINLVGWREGTYLLRDMPLSKEVVNLAMPGRSLLVRALQQLDDRELVVERLGTMEAVLLRQATFDEVARGLDFGFVTDELLAAVDGKRTVREVCEVSGLDDFQACKVLYTLVVLGALGPEARPPRELIFVEGELQNGEQIPRVDESKARRSWLRAAPEPAPGARPAPAVQPAPAARTSPTAPDTAPPNTENAGPAAPEEPAAASGAGIAGEPQGPSQDASTPAPAAPAPVRRRWASRSVLWAGALAILLLAIGASLYYATYLRPTLDPDDVEESRLMAALVDELEEAGEIEPAGPSSPSEAGVVPGVPDTGGSLKPGPEPPPPGEGAVKPTPRLATAPPAADREPPLTRTPSAEPPALEKPALLTMLSKDGNFREALNLVRKQRIPEAAESFQRALVSQQAGTHTIQLLLACQDSTVEKAFDRAPDRMLFFVTTTFRGQTCYRLFDGLYASAAEARGDLDSIPATFREDGNRPVIVRVPRR